MLTILRESLSKDLDPETGKKRVTGYEDITAGCKLLPFYDVHNQDKKRIVFRPGAKPISHPDGSKSGGEENVGVKYVDGTFRDTYEAQPGFVFRGVELKKDKLLFNTEAQMLSMPPQDASFAEPLEDVNPVNEGVNDAMVNDAGFSARDVPQIGEVAPVEPTPEPSAPDSTHHSRKHR